MKLSCNSVKAPMKFTLSILFSTFDTSKCKTAAKMAVSRIKLLRNKRETIVRQMRRDIALLLQSGNDTTARIRVEHVIREQNILVANELIEIFCELIVSRLAIIAKERECPTDLREGISSLVFAAPRCSEIPELSKIKKIFEKKYGKDFVASSTELRPNCSVNRTLIDKLSVRTPDGDTKLRILKDIAKQHKIAWDTADSERELLKVPDKLIEGPRTFVSASCLPIRETGADPYKPICGSGSEAGVFSAARFVDPDAAAQSARQAVEAASTAAFLAHAHHAQGMLLNTQKFDSDARISRDDADVAANSRTQCTLSGDRNGQSYVNSSGREEESHMSQHRP